MKNLTSLFLFVSCCLLLELTSCTKTKELPELENSQVNFKIKKTTKTAYIHPLFISSTITGTKINLTWTKPNDVPSNASVVTKVNYNSGFENYTFYVFAGGTSHSYNGTAGQTYTVTVTLSYSTATIPLTTIVDTKEVSIPSNAQTNPQECTAPTAQMSFPYEIEFAAPNGGTLTQQDNQIIVRLPADYSANQIWIIRYKKNDYVDSWHYSSSFPSSGFFVYGRSFNFQIFNNLDGEYIFELGVVCNGVATNFTNTSYASTIVL